MNNKTWVATFFVVSAVAFVVAGALSLSRFASKEKPVSDYLHTTVKASESPLPLQRVRLLTPRLVLLAAAKAEVYWGGTRCSSITFDFERLGDSRIAEAQWLAAPDSTQYLDCRVTFNTDPTKIRTTFWHYCGAVIHEYGHLSGHGHSLDRRNIMFASLSDRNVPATCKRLVYP